MVTVSDHNLLAPVERYCVLSGVGYVLNPDVEY